MQLLEDQEGDSPSFRWDVGLRKPDPPTVAVPPPGEGGTLMPEDWEMLQALAFLPHVCDP